jgi:two-component system, cell cycle sensor histidine kinase DivJ
LRVLRNIVDRLTSLPVRLVDVWVPGVAAGDPVVAHRLQQAAGCGLGALALAPAALCLVLSPAVALPVGVGGAASLMLALTALMSGDHDAPEMTVAAPADRDDAGFGGEPMLDILPGLVTIHSERGIVQSVRGRDRDALMRDLRPLEGRGFLDQIHVSDRITFLQAIDAMRQGGHGGAVNLRFEARGADDDAHGQFVHRRLMLGVLPGARGGFSGFFCQMFDNAEEEKMKRELAAKAAEAHSANEAKTRFLAAVSHELRTPLNAILGFSDILSGEYFGKLENDRQREYVSLINQSGQHLLGVVNTMLDMSKIEAGRYELLCESFAAADVAHASEAMLSLQAKNKGVTLTARVAREAGELVADRRAVQQVLINIVGNALKFTDAGGVVSLDVDRRGSEVVFSVSDTGIGIAADKIALLGRPFVQVQNDYARKYEGTGLGLSLVKGLVELHGGRMAIESRLGEGTVVSISLPVAGPDVAATGASGGLTAEFPPRLLVAAKSMNDKEENAHDNAKAQTA